MRSQFKGYFYSLLVWPITVKLNPSTVDKYNYGCECKHCSLFSVWLLYKSIFLLTQLSTAIYNFRTTSLIQLKF